MSHLIFRFHPGRRRSRINAGFAAAAVFLAISGALTGQIPYPTPAGDMVLCESSGAARVVEKVRSGVQGVMMEVFVKPGDPVRKGQILGHTELDATKLQLDLAKHALESKGNVEAALAQSEAWTVTREETERAVKDRKAEKSRLEWATAMESFHRGNHQIQMETEGAQAIQFDYWQRQYEKRFFRAPVDGIVSEILVGIGKPVNFATHVFTISNNDAYALTVTVPASLADGAVPQETLPVRSHDGKSTSRALVDSVMDDPVSAGRKIIRLLVQPSDFSAVTRAKLAGMSFDVLLPPVAAVDSH